jgi:alpha-N-arabinofuranosidase
MTRIRIREDFPRAVINPNIYGHFAEHLGRCVYEGIWVGPKSKIPNQDGLRLDVIAVLSHLRTPVVRWPGGCFADAYHWRDGIGPVENRPQTVNLWWRQTDPNTFGTDEYARLCQALGCNAYICANVGSGSPREALEWLEYCNFSGDSTLTRLRAAKPHNIKYWGIGNENWGCGGRYTAPDYAKEFVRYASYLRALDPNINIIACGCSPMDYQNPGFVSWNHDFCAAMPHPDLIDQLSIHRYFSRGSGAGFSDSEYHALFADLVTFERDLQQADELLAYFYPNKHVGVAVDEWGVWHPSAVVDNGLEQENTLRDAVFAGAALNLMNRYAHRVTMANIAQTINVLQCMTVTQGGDMFLTPTYHIFDMMRPHMGAQSLAIEVQCPTYDGHPVGLKTKMPVPTLNASVSVTGNKLFLTVANQTIDQDIEARVELSKTKISAATGRILNAPNASDTNSFKNAKIVVPHRVKVELEPDSTQLVHMFPAHSFTALTLTLG